jgi:hypothetical protein
MEGLAAIVVLLVLIAYLAIRLIAFRNAFRIDKDR